MRKIIYPILFITLMLMLIGCEKAVASMPIITSDPSADISDNSISTFAIKTSGSAVTSQTVTSLDISKIQGKINNLYYFDNNQVLIVADKLYLYDMYSKTIIHQTDKVPFTDERYLATNGGIAGVGTECGTACVIYDKGLNKIAEISSAELFGEYPIDFSSHMALSGDGNKLAFATMEGLFIYDVNSKTKKTLVNLTDDNAAKRSGLALFDQIEFVNGDKMVAFKSQSFDVPAIDGKPSFDTYGTINIDGSGLSVKKSTDYMVKELVAYDSFLLLCEDFTVPTGKVRVQDFASGNPVTLQTATQKESGNVFGSEDGQFFATANVEDSGVTIRIYDRPTGSLVREEKIVRESEYMSRVPVVRIFDNMRTCIVLLGNRQPDIQTAYHMFNF